MVLTPVRASIGCIQAGCGPLDALRLPTAAPKVHHSQAVRQSDHWVLHKEYDARETACCHGPMDVVLYTGDTTSQTKT